MAIIDARYYSTSLPPQSSAAGGVAGARTDGQATPLQRSHANNHAPADIDWSALGEAGTHRVITVNANTGGPTGETLDVLVDSILSRIGSRTTPGQ